MISLEDVGKILLLDSLRGQPKVRVIMVIEAPRGICAIFTDDDTARIIPYRHTVQRYTKQCKAIEAFMNEYQHD